MNNLTGERTASSDVPDPPHSLVRERQPFVAPAIECIGKLTAITNQFGGEFSA